MLTVSGLYLLDQVTKWWTVKHVVLGEHLPVIPGRFDWVHFSNTGAAFGVMQNQNLFFVGLSLVALVGLWVATRCRIFPGKRNQAAIWFLVSGILGNLTDRLWHGYVVDFLLFDLGFAPANPWPAFNVADSCICVSVALLLWASFREGASVPVGKA